MKVPNFEIDKLSPMVKALFLKWRDFMRDHLKFNRPDSPLHSMDHCERVLLYGLLIGERVWGDNPEKLTQIAEAAVFHDTRRQDDSLDKGHGARAAVYYQQYCKAHADFPYYPVVPFMMRYHDLSDKAGIEAIRKEFGSDAADALTQYAILKDADALDRWRLGRNGLDQRFLRTDAAKQLVDYARSVVAQTVPAEIIDEIERVIEGQIALMSKPRMLIIVDPQVDFITGTLPVPGAESAMNDLAAYLGSQAGKYAEIIVTADRHPYRHCSFVGCGGKWPRHCVHDSVGAAMWPALFKPIYDSGATVHFFYKGQQPDKEEYSIFQNGEAAQTIKETFEKRGCGIVDICGLAGDVCVAATTIDAIGLFGENRVRVLPSYSPSIDGGKSLQDLIRSNHLA